MSLSNFQCVMGKTLSFFATDPTQIVDRAVIEELLAESRARGRCNARVCLHDSPEAAFHQMIILEWEDSYFPPHRHPTKGESIHIIQGQLAMVTFDQAGDVQISTVLGHNGEIICRVGPGDWHFTCPLTDYVIYHEIKPGPFRGEADREFAPWAPKADEPKGDFYDRIFDR